MPTGSKRDFQVASLRSVPSPQVAHELRVPLNAMMGFTQMVLVDLEITTYTEQRHYLLKVLDAGAHLNVLIGSLLGNAERNHLQPVPSLNLRTVIDRAHELAMPLAWEKGVSIKIKAPAALRAIGHSTHLIQALSNVLSNAVKYNRNGGWVELTAGLDEKPWIEVADGGLGLTQLQRAHLFEPYNRLGAEDGPIEGTGLGLFISRQLIREMGGDLRVVDREDAKTVFRIELQGALPSTSILSPLANIQDAIPPRNASDSPGQTVLCVEDDDLTAVLLEESVGQVGGANFVLANTVRQAVSLAAALKPSLMVLDLHLPDGTGFDVKLMLAQCDETADIPCILLTGDDSECTRVRAMQLGFVEVHHKPLNIKKLQRSALNAIARQSSSMATANVSEGI